jgi:hypothetical protein
MVNVAAWRVGAWRRGGVGGVGGGRLFFGAAFFGALSLFIAKLIIIIIKELNEERAKWSAAKRGRAARRRLPHKPSSVVARGVVAVVASWRLGRRGVEGFRAGKGSAQNKQGVGRDAAGPTAGVLKKQGPWRG